MRRGVSQSALAARERMTFVEHIARLEQRLAEVERELARKPRPVPPVGTGQVTPEPEPPPTKRRKLVFKHSVYRPGSGLGSLTFDQALNAHAPNVTTREVAQAAGVTCPSVSRWRIANRLTSLWVLPEEIPDCWRSQPRRDTIDPDPMEWAPRDFGALETVAPRAFKGRM